MTSQTSWDPHLDTNVLRIFYAGTRHECIGGRHFSIPSANAAARRIVRNLYAFLRPFIHARGLGQVYLDPADLVLGPDDVIQPDIVFVRAEHVSTGRLPLAAGTPDLVVEIVTAQEGELARAKARLCEEYRIPEYWLVTPAQQRIDVFRLTGGGSIESTTLRHLNETLVSSQLRGLQIPLAEVFV